jgi:transposase InsO family protein
MPWEETNKMTQRIKFLELYNSNQFTVAALARDFKISRKTAYKWIQRCKENGTEEFLNKSTRPSHIPIQISDDIKNLILETREQFPVWGARKLKKYLENQGNENLPCESTFNRTLKKNGYISAEETLKRKAFIRFEHENPNDLWQMDFKGYFRINGVKCCPLTILDDHSRFSLCLKACHNQTENTVRNHLISVFREYGLPNRMTMDNGSPWGSSGRSYTRLSVWLMRLGVLVSYSRPYHPQTQGKDERFHRSLKDEVLKRYLFESHDAAQKQFDVWRPIYNYERPHEGISLEVPAKRYKRSVREYPEKLNEIEYEVGEIVRKVHSRGYISFQGHDYYLGEVFQGNYIALRESDRKNHMEAYFNRQKIKIFDLENDWIK